MKSGRPEDLETANRLIKSTIQEVSHGPRARLWVDSRFLFMCVRTFQEQDKAEKTLKRESTLKEVESSTKQLRELLERHKMAEASFRPSDDLQVC